MTKGKIEIANSVKYVRSKASSNEDDLLVTSITSKPKRKAAV